MLDLDPDDDLALLVETARKFATEALLPRLRESESRRDVEPELHRLYEEIGLAGLELPEALGGAALGALARSLVNEELAAGDPGAAIRLDRLGPALYPVLELGGEDALASLVAHLDARGVPARACLVFAEDAPLDVSEDHVSGTIPWIPIEGVEALVWISANQALIVQEGIVSAPVRGAGLRAAGACELRLDEAPIAARWTDPTRASRARARTRLAIASLMLGTLRFTCEFSRKYALEREAFGRPIAHHQALAFLITDMRMNLDGARLLVHEAAWRLDARRGGEAEAASAFAQCIDAARFIGPNGVQILGGHGFMADYPMEKAMREARVLGLLCGGFDAAIDEAGARICELGAPVSLGVERAAGATSEARS